MRQRPALLAIYRARVNALSATQDLGRKKISPAVEGSGHVDIGPPSVCPCCRWHGVTARGPEAAGAAVSQPDTTRDQATSVHFDRSPQFVPLAPVAFGPITTPYGTYGPAIPATPGVDDTAPKMFPRPTRTTQLRSQEYPTQRTCHRSSSSSKIGKGL